MAATARPWYSVVQVTTALVARVRHHIWGDPTAGLLDGTAWDKARPQICRDLGLSPEPGVDLDRWAARLDTACRQLADGLADNPSVRIEDRDGRDHLVLTGLDRLGEPGSLTELRGVSVRLVSPGTRDCVEPAQLP